MNPSFISFFTASSTSSFIRPSTILSDHGITSETAGASSSSIVVSTTFPLMQTSESLVFQATSSSKSYVVSEVTLH